MSVQVCIAHNGQCLVFDEPTARLEDLRPWIETHTGIPTAMQIVMNGRGKNIKNLKNETEVYVYDKRFLSSDSKPPPSRHDKLPKLSEPPAPSSNESDITAWHNLLMSRRTWALEASETIRSGLDATDKCLDEAEVIARSIRAALDNLRNHATSLQQKFETTHRWARDLLQEQKDVLAQWRESADALAELPVREDVAKILSRSTEQGSQAATSQNGTLSDLIQPDVLEAAASSLQRTSELFEGDVEALQAKMKSLNKESIDAEKLMVELQSADTSGFVEETETLVKRMSNDYEEVLKLGDGAKAVSAASRKAATQQRDFVPVLQGIMEDVLHASNVAQQSRNDAAEKCYQTLQELSRIQSELAENQGHISRLNFNDDESLHNLDRIFQLPMIYGATLTEAARRSEWTERMRVEVDAMHQDISQHTEEEQRRRKKWSSSYGDFLNIDLNAADTLIDLKASKPRNAWPFVNRDEIFAYIDDLRALKIDDAVQAVTTRLKELDAPVRKSRPSPFKNGSVHELSHSGTLRNGDTMRILKDDKVRLEDKLRASESRVRKLEDLLHRQSQLSRPASGSFVPGIGGAPEFERQFSTPITQTRPADFSRRSSASVRRSSNNQDEKPLAQRIVSLEAQIQKLQEEAHAERRSSTESRDRMNEAESVKRDLLANFEAQKQEFDDERQVLDDENHKLKIKLEELEEELDRVLDSKDHDKMTYDHKVSELKAELDRLRKTFAEDVERAGRKSEDLQKDVHTQRDRASTLERQMHQLREERNSSQNQNVSLAHELRLLEEQQQDFVASLQSAHANLSPAGSPPEEMRRLINALEILSEGAAIHARGLDDSLQLATAENMSLEERLTQAEAESKRVKEQLATVESKTASLNESLAQERNKLSATRLDLADEQAELRNLRAKFAAGETGSDTLKERLASEERKVGELTELKLENEGLIQSLRNEIGNVTAEIERAAAQQHQMKERFNNRGEKARQLSEKLFQHNDRIIRMLEQFGYSITRQDETLVIQRTSRVRESILLFGGERPSTMSRTISGSAPPQHYSDPADLETLYWTSDGESSHENGKYQGFLMALQRLDLDATIDLITKRYKDVENLAKKYQKESRAYREKSHRLQSEAHEKIAYRSFKEGDLALFLPTRNQATRPWAAFNVGAPHYFLREQDAHKLQARDWLLARISKVEERLVDLSRTMSSSVQGKASIHTEVSDGASARSIDDDNPFELSDGLRWYLIDASEEKPGAPGTPGLGKSTVTSTNVEVKGHMGRKEKSGGGGGGNAVQLTKNLNKSLDSRRSSSASKRSGSIRGRGEGSSIKDVQTFLAPITSDTDAPGDEPVVKASDADARDGVQRAREDAKVFDVNTPNKDKKDSPRKLMSASGQLAQIQSHNQSLSKNESQAPSRTASPLKQRAASPTKSPAMVPSPAKGKSWDKLFSVEYHS